MPHRAWGVARRVAAAFTAAVFLTPVQKRKIFGRAMYDFANPTFATTLLAVIFTPDANSEEKRTPVL